MAIRTKCPGCKHLHTLADNLLGKMIRCKACAEPFEVKPVQPKPDADDRPTKGAVASGAPPRRPQIDQLEVVDDEDERRRPSGKPVRRQEVDDEDEDDDRPRRSKQRRRGAKQPSPVVWIVSGVVGVLSFAGAFALVYFLTRGPQAAPVAQNPQPGVNVPGVNPPAGNQPGVNPPAGNQPGFNLPQNPPVGNNPAPPGNLYGDQGGDEVLPADPTKPDTVLRARSEDTFYKLSNPRLGQSSNKFSKGKGEVIILDWEVTRRGKQGGGTLIVHDGQHRESVVGGGFGQQQDRGTIELSAGFGPFNSLPKNAEFYVVRRDARWGKDSPSFKVSNSVFLGAINITTKARNWTQEEIARYTKDPPNYANPNAHPGIGQDTQWAGNPKGGLAQRYVEPKGHLLGFDYLVNDWQNEKCFWRLGPVFSNDQEKVHSDRIVAKQGYAVADAEVYTGKYIDGLKLTFQKIKADGTLDAADSYTSELIGHAGQGPPLKLGGDNRPVIGLHIRHGAVIDAMALVVR